MTTKKTVTTKVGKKTSGKKKKKTTRKKTPTKKKTTRKKTATRQSSANLKIEKALIENFIGLQKVMTNMSVKFDNLTIQISKLLELFEISAKAIVEKNLELGTQITNNGKESDVVNKVNTLLDQNKILARGLTLLHEKTPEQNYPTQTIQPPIQQNIGLQGYQKSITSTPPKIMTPPLPTPNNRIVQKPSLSLPKMPPIPQNISTPNNQIIETEKI